MTIEDKIRNEKLQYHINEEVAKISALLSDKFYEYEYLTDEEVLHSDQRRIIEQAKFTYSRLGKAFEKQRRLIKDAAETQRKTMEEVKSKNGFETLNSDQQLTSIGNLFSKYILATESKD